MPKNVLTFLAHKQGIRALLWIEHNLWLSTLFTLLNLCHLRLLQQVVSEPATSKRASWQPCGNQGLLPSWPPQRSVRSTAIVVKQKRSKLTLPCSVTVLQGGTHLHQLKFYFLTAPDLKKQKTKNKKQFLQNFYSLLFFLEVTNSCRYDDTAKMAVIYM